MTDFKYLNTIFHFGTVGIQERALAIAIHEGGGSRREASDGDGRKYLKFIFFHVFFSLHEWNTQCNENLIH